MKPSPQTTGKYDRAKLALDTSRRQLLEDLVERDRPPEEVVRNWAERERVSEAHAYEVVKATLLRSLLETQLG